MPEVDSGHWLYTGDPLQSDRDEVRFLVGDTQSSDQLLSDEEINAALGVAAQGTRPGGDVSTNQLLVNGTPASGATSISLRAAAVTGKVMKGDSFTISGDTTRYFVTNTVSFASNVATDIEIEPGLVGAKTDGTAVALRWANISSAAALCCEHLSRRFAREADVQVGDKKTSYSQRSMAFAKAGERLRLQASGGSGREFGIALVRV